MATKTEYIEALRPYLIGEEPREHNGEWDMFCPLHEDVTRSASLNVHSSEWFCQKCDIGGSVVELIRMRPEWVPPPATASSNGARRSRSKPELLPTEASLQGWLSSLLGNDQRMSWLTEKRLLLPETIIRYQIGWDRDKHVYTIPVRDREGKLVNVRRYNPEPLPGRRKIWGCSGHNEVRLYPIEQLEYDELVWHEGEWDAILTIQKGWHAITRTGSAKVFEAQWGPLFKGKKLWVCQDCDEDGVAGTRKVCKLTGGFAIAFPVALPYPIEPKHGKDITDFWGEYDEVAFAELLKSSESVDEQSDEPPLITVAESFDAKRVGQKVAMVVTIKGKAEPGYTIAREVKLTCTQDAGDKCRSCPLNGAGGEDTFPITEDDPMALELMDSSNSQIAGIIARNYGITGGRCNRLSIEPSGYQSVEVLYARPSLDNISESTSDDYKNIKITSVGRHNTLPNNTVRVTGALWPNPRNQTSEFLASVIERQTTSVDHFELTPENVRLMSRFQAHGRPLAKLAEISKQISTHVTKIYGRPEMHALIDLVFHSVQAFEFSGELVHRGWLEGLIIGDTRTGKSEAANKIVRHHQAGEVVSGESSSIAGLVGGLQQIGNGKQWAVTWGAIPINDRRLVVIDELSGMAPQDISKMSDIRSSGIIKIQKIQQEMTMARTRLLWLSNPRDSKMWDYTYGVQALYPLVGNAEDIARFDIMMCVRIDDVKPEEINRPHPTGVLRYTSDACATLVRWVWTRTADQIIFTSGTEQAVYAAALELGRRYIEDPPLLQAANARVKVARLATALAARLFSTDDSHELVLVKPEHVRDAVSFLDKLYGMPSMGYLHRSSEVIQDRLEAETQYYDMEGWLRNRPSLVKFLKDSGKFRRQDLEEVLNVDRGEANGVVNHLIKSRMVRKVGANVQIEPTLHRLLRELKV